MSTTSTDALSDKEIATVGDLQSRAAGPSTIDTDGSEPTPPVRDRFESTAIDQVDVPILVALSCQRTGAISFAARSDVQRRIDQTTSGYDATV